MAKDGSSAERGIPSRHQLPLPVSYPPHHRLPPQKKEEGKARFLQGDLFVVLYVILDAGSSWGGLHPPAVVPLPLVE